MLNTKVVSAKAARPSGPGSAGAQPWLICMARASSRAPLPAVGSRAPIGPRLPLGRSDRGRRPDAALHSYPFFERRYPHAVFFRQIIHEDLGCASYLVGDTASGVAAVIDPQWDIDPYLHLARLQGVRIEHALETHNHADHVSGHGRLARATGATIHVHELAAPEYAHEPFADGWILQLGEGPSIAAN